MYQYRYGIAMKGYLYLTLCLICVSLFSAKDPVIKTYRDKAVYTLHDGVKHAIPDWSTFVSLGYDVNEIKTLEDADMAKIPEGEPASAIVEEALPENPLRGCPCISEDSYMASQHPPEHKQKLLCFIDNKQSTELFQKFDPKMMNIQHKLIPDAVLDNFNYQQTITQPPETKGCDVVINLVDGDLHGNSPNSTRDFDKYVCPELCMPVPYTELPLSWLLLATTPPQHKTMPAANLVATRALTCTLTYAEMWKDVEIAKHHHGKESKDSNNGPDHQHALKSMAIALHAIARRRFEECNEHHLWQGAVATPRKVHGLILWVGSRTRYPLLASQIEILRNQSSDPNTRIMGWLASEDQYACRTGSALCYDLSNSMAYFPLMPSSRMNVAAAGWSCAQRRMLRALQHVLLLFDPFFVLVVDDDTYVNVQLLNPGGGLDKFIRTELPDSNLIMGSLTLGKKVTNKGFYWGGAGYLFGKQTIDNLNSRHIKGPATPSDAWRDEGKWRTLAVIKQVYEKSQSICKDCIQMDGLKLTDEGLIDVVGASGNTTARLVEICTNLMSPEHTCYHSDHAMSRCLLYAAGGTPLQVACTGSEIGRDKVLVGMCMGTDNCGENHLTCHRFYPHPNNALIGKGQYIRRRR